MNYNPRVKEISVSILIINKQMQEKGKLFFIIESQPINKEEIIRLKKSQLAIIIEIS